MSTNADLRNRLPSAEALLERRFERDTDVHAAMKAGRSAAAVANEFGLTRDEVRAIYGSIEFPNVMLENLAAARYRARKRTEAAESRAAADAWPPARIRNILNLEFGVPLDRMGDAALIAEAVTRSAIVAVPMAGAKAADRVAAFLSSMGLALRD